MTKRTFIRQSVLLAAASPLLMHGCHSGGNTDWPAATQEQKSDLATSPAKKMPYLDTIGLQLWTVRNQLAADPETTLRTVAELGYHQVELMDTRQAEKLLPICHDLGLKVNSSFMQWSTITGRWDLVPEEKTPFTFDEVLDQASTAELSHLVFGYLQPGSRDSIDAYKKLAEQLNEAALKAKRRGIQMAYHNHNFEFEEMEGQIPFEVLTERLDKELMPFELDVFWAAIAGYDPAALLARLGGQVKLLHLKDLQAKTPITTSLDDIAPEAFQELGNGTLPIKALAELGKEMGVDYCFVEQDQSPAPLESIQQSIQFLNG